MKHEKGETDKVFPADFFIIIILMLQFDYSTIYNLNQNIHFIVKCKHFI